MAGKFEKVNTFTGSSVASLTLGSIFSADYNFYNVYIRGGMTGVSDIAAERPTLKVLTAAGAEFSTGIYDFTSFELNGSNITDNNANADQDNSILNKLGLSIVVIHVGGPRIKREQDKSNIIQL